MGKIRAKKTSRVHLKAAQGSLGGSSNTISKNEEYENLPNAVDTSTTSGNTASNYQTCLPPVKLDANPFSGIKIKKDVVIKQQLTYPDPEPPKVTVKTDVVMPKRKKDKMKFRREQFIKKLEVAEAVKAKRKKSVRRSKTPVVRDMDVLKMELPDLSAPSEKPQNKDKLKNRNKKIDKKRKPKKKKKKQYHGLADIQDFQNFVKKHNDLTDIKDEILKTIKRRSL